MEIRIYHCADCQRRLPRETSFCPQCGHSTTDAVHETTADPPTAEFTAPYPPRSTWELALVRPDGDQVVFPVPGDVRIGRSSENDLPLQDHQVSRFHAMIEKRTEGLFLKDLGSTNGTFVNRKRVHSAVRLRAGDAITIGQFRFLVQRDSLNCGHCGRLVKSDYLYCTHCGEPLTGLSVSRSLPTSDFDALPTDPLEKPVNSPAERPASISPPGSLQTAPPAAGNPAAPNRLAAPGPGVPAAPKPFAAPGPGVPAAPKPADPVDKPGNVVRTDEPKSNAAEAPLPPPPKPLPPIPSAVPDETPANSRLLQGCAIAFVVGLCLLATLALVGYWLYSAGFL